MQKQNNPKAEFQAMLERSKKMKKKILILLICCAVCVALLFGTIELVEYLTFLKDTTVPEGTFDFYPVYSGDIFEYDDYMHLNRQISYCDDPAGYGTTTVVTEDTKEDFEPPVLFLCDYIESIIMGDSHRYNQFFNRTYFKKVEPKTSFAQQMLYDIKITYYSTEEGKNGSKLISYRLEYMIFENNGTFRRDIGSDMSRPQIVTLRVEKDGSMAIEKLITVFIK